MAPPKPTSAEAALGELRWLRALALRLVRDEHAADDLVQETWLAAAQHGPVGLDGAGLRKWLATVARNRFRRRLRDEAVRARHESARPALSAPEPPPDEVERLRRQRLVADLVLALREPYRSAVLLRYQDGWSYARIAARHGISRDAARKRVSRGLALLRAELDRAHGGDRGAWCALLAGLVDRDAAPFATALTTGGIAMGTKSIAAAAATLVVAVGLVAWSVRSGGHARPSATERSERPAAELVGVAEPAPVRAPVGAPERVAVVALSAPAPGALATVNLERDLHGRVLDPEGAPVPGARIAVRHDALRQVDGLDLQRDKSGVEVAAVVSDARGEFAIPLALGRPYELVVEKEGFARAQLADRYAGERVDVHLDAPAVFAGRVFREEDGVGVPAVLNAWTRDVGATYLIDGVRTRDDGTFRIEGLEARRMTLEVHPEGAADPEWRAVQLVAGEVTELEIACAPGHTLRGTVTDAETGHPIAGAEVGQGWTYDKPVLTDAAGRYVFEHYRIEGIWEIAARAHGYGQIRRPIESSAEGLVVDFALRRGSRIVGRVVDPAGAPVAGVYVAAVGSELGPLPQSDWRSAGTRSDGTFEITAVNRDLRHVLSLFHDAWAAAVYDLPADEREHELVDVGTIALEPQSLLRGAVVHADGEPVTQCRVELHGTNADRARLGGAPIEDALGPYHYVALREARVDHLGRFSFANLGAGSYEIVVRPPDGTDARKRVHVPRATVVDDVRIDLDLGLAIAGRVVGPTGEPMAAYVAIQHSGSGRRSTFSAADGSFRIAGLAAGLYQVQAFPIGDDANVSGTVLADVAAGTSGLEIALRTADVIAGRVVDAAGAPVLNAPILARSATGANEALAFTDPDGRFELRVEPGAVLELVASPPQEGGAFRPGLPTESEKTVTLPGVLAGDRDVIITLELD